MVLCLPVSSFAQSKDDLIKQAQAAEGKGDVVGARDGYCGASKKDPGDANAKQSCDTYQKEVTRVENRSNQNYLDGVAALQNNDFDGALIKFKNVKAGPQVAEAQKKIAAIPDLKANFQKQQQAGAQAEQAVEAKFNGAVSSFNNGDIPSAKSGFNGISGKHAQEAQDYMAKIKNYEAKMNEAGIYASSNDYQSAKKSYTDASIALGFQPQVLKDKISEMNKLMAGTAPTNPIPSNPVTPVNNTKPNNANAVKEVVIDEAALLADAHKFYDKKDYKKARRNAETVLGRNFKNKDAKDLLDQINSVAPADTKSGDEDPILVGLVGQFYKGNYDDAQSGMSYYLLNNPKKPGIANFYLGLIYATQYYLGGSSDNDRDPKLMQKAKSKFKDAKGVQGFTAPEKLISPKILTIYKSS